MNMWKLWKIKALCCALVCCLMAACGGYQFDSAAESGSYAQAAGSMPQAQDFGLMANASPLLDLSSGRANVMLGNPEENRQRCRVQLLLDATGEVLYETELAPGEREAYALLPVEAFSGAGEYAATAVFAILDEAGSTRGSVEAAVRITAE